MPNRFFRYCITSCITGAAPATPETSCIAIPPKFPTQTPTVNSGVKPTAQLSRKSVLVPVFAATGKSNASAESRPNSRDRASLSLNISAISQACRASKTRADSATSSANNLYGRYIPSLARAAYALVNSSKVTSALPMVSPSPYSTAGLLSVVTPHSFSRDCNLAAPPTCCKTRTAGTFSEFANANRKRTGPENLRPKFCGANTPVAVAYSVGTSANKVAGDNPRSMPSK